MSFLSHIWNKLSRQKYRPLNTIKISASALKHNHDLLQQLHPEARVCPVLKSNAYGHGLTTVAPIFDTLGCPFLIVDSLYEAYQLSDLQVQTPILILGYTYPTNYSYKSLPYHFVVYDWATAQALAEFQPGSSVHIFVDTGMHREGVPLHHLSSFIKKIMKLGSLKIVGLLTHCADADNPDSQEFTNEQHLSFAKALEIMRQEGLEPTWTAMSASAAAGKIFDPQFSLVRAGLASYGISPLDLHDPSAHVYSKLRPALSFYSTLVQIKDISAGEHVGYNCTFTAKKKMKVGLLPAGYYEGVDRRLSSKGLVSIDGTVCPILGRVSMNMTVIDISTVSDPQIGMPVCIYSADPQASNSIARAAATAGTIPYELLVKLSESVKRVAV